MKFTVNRKGLEQGPWSVDEIIKKIESHEIEWSDYVFDTLKKDWVLILQQDQFADHFRKSKISPETLPATNSSSSVSKEPEWYVLRDDNRYGPFSHLEVVKMLQQKKVHEYDYVWNRPLMKSWQQIHELEDFKPEKIKALKDAGGEKIEEIFFRRRHARAHYGASIILHNNKEVWRGTSLEVSAGGAGLVLDSEAPQIGQSLFLHFKAGDGVPPFNATCTIVSKKKQEHGYRYGVRFTTISQSIQKAIKKYTDQAA